MKINTPYYFEDFGYGPRVQLTRRNFLFVAGAGAAALALPGCSTSSSGPSPSLSLPNGLGVPPAAYLPTTGAPAYPSSVRTAGEASQIALAMARTALAQKTFAVGGVIVENSTGRVITAMHNNVIRQLPNSPASAFTWDPTAHGERQLVSWYYANVDQLKLPPPTQLTIVTSLDPCAQCAGSQISKATALGCLSAFDESRAVGASGSDHDQRSTG